MTIPCAAAVRAMRKQILNPDTGGEWAEHETAYSEGVVVHHPDHKRVHLSGRVSDAETIADQTERCLQSINDDLVELDGSMRDVVRVRIFVVRPYMTPDTIEAIHAVRREYFEPGHYPASTLLEVESLVREAYQIEFEADAVIPNDDWDVDVL